MSYTGALVCLESTVIREEAGRTPPSHWVAEIRRSAGRESHRSTHRAAALPDSHTASTHRRAAAAHGSGDRPRARAHGKAPSASSFLWVPEMQTGLEKNEKSEDAAPRSLLGNPFKLGTPAPENHFHGRVARKLDT